MWLATKEMLHLTILSKLEVKEQTQAIIIVLQRGLPICTSAEERKGKRKGTQSFGIGISL